MSHLIFMDNVIFLVQGSFVDLLALKRVIELFYKATRMEINNDKSCLLTFYISYNCCS